MTVHRFAALAWLLLAVVVGLYSLLRLPLGTLGEPGPGFFPAMAATALAVAALVVVLKLGAGVAAPYWGTREDLRRRVVVAAAVLGFGLALERVGFVLCTFAFLLVVLRVVYHPRWYVALALSVLVSVGLYVLFNWWLGVELPRGVAGF